MSSFVLSPLARADLEAIWNYSTDRWGVDQAERYLRIIEDACRQLATKPGVVRDDIRPGYRRVRAGSHLIFYRDVDGIADIARILHGSMDVGRHLSPEE